MCPSKSASSDDSEDIHEVSSEEDSLGPRPALPLDSEDEGEDDEWVASDDIVEARQYLREVREEARQLGGNQFWRSEGKIADKGAEKCSYVRYILDIDKEQAESPTNVGPPVMNAKNTDEGTDRAWEDAIFESFQRLRNYLAAASEESPELAGETDADAHTADPPERSWDTEKWRTIIQEEAVTVKRLGASDSVRSMHVLVAVVDLLDELSGQPPTERTDDRVKRICQWAFAALASLDTVQAMDADVAHTLQRLKRRSQYMLRQCSENRSSPEEGPGEEMLCGLRIQIFIVTAFFKQK